MIGGCLAQASEWATPVIDWHAIAPELVLIVGINVVLASDLLVDESRKWATASLTGFVLLGASIPLVTLAVSGDGPRSLFDGRYVIDDFALVLKALFLLTGYVVVLLSQNELEEGGYYQGEYYVLLLCSVLGMVMMSSSRDLVSVFIALELLSIPAYMLAAWRKRDGRSNEAGVKYYLLGVFASGVLLYGMSLLYGATATTRLVDIGAALADQDVVALEVIAVAFVVAGFGFKVSGGAVPHWAPDTYEGAPLPVTAFLSVASKAAGFVALILVIFLAFPTVDGVYGPLVWVLSALTMTVGNVIALRQTNIVRMLAYSSVSQGGFILMPLAFVGTDDVAEAAMKAVVVYLLVYAFTNLGAFAVVIAVARTTRSGRISSFAGLINYAPGTGRVVDDLPRLARRGAAARRLDRQVQRVQRRPRCRHDGGVRARRHRRREHGDRRRLLPPRDAHDVDGPAARGAPAADRHAAAGDGGAGDHRGRHRRARCCSGLVMRFADLQDLTGAFGS